MLDIENLDAGQEFEELPDTYTIFITEKDLYGMGELLYVIERMNLTTGKGFGDGEHIIRLNYSYCRPNSFFDRLWRKDINDRIRPGIPYKVHIFVCIHNTDRVFFT